jgi:hypothetical protein
MAEQYEVLSPWAEADPVPQKKMAPRIERLSGKRIGLLRNSKRAASPSMEALEKRLKERFPDSEISHYAFMPNAGIAERPEWIEPFENWLKGVDAVVLAYGD